MESKQPMSNSGAQLFFMMGRHPTQNPPTILVKDLMTPPLPMCQKCENSENSEKSEIKKNEKFLI